MGKFIPLDVLMGNPEKAAPSLSPDGRRMAYLAPVNGVLNVWVGRFGEDNYRPVTNDTDRGIGGYVWAHNGRHLLYIQDHRGDENWRVYSVDLESGKTKDLTPFEGVQARIEKIEKRYPDELIVGLNKDNPQLHDLYHLNLLSGDLTKVAENPGFVSWVVDHNLHVRGAVQPTAEGGLNLLVRDSANDEWRPFLQFPPEDALFSSPLGFTLDGRAMYLRTSVDANAARLVRKELASSEEKLVAGDELFDVGGIIIHPDTKEVQAVAYVRDRLDWEVLDDAIRDDFDAIRQIQRGDFGISGRDHADKKWLISFTTDNGPVTFYVFDRVSKKPIFLFDHRPELKQYTLANKEAFSLKARDGLELHGYLTFPPDRGRTKLPTVLSVHGGPWERDTWGFDPESQWFANRGYLTIQVNFRGSLGYGKQFLNAGDREWGGKMQEDLIDTVAWAVERQLSDPDRIAIFGTSYGGYAALCGATFTPEAFRCAVSICGPANLKTWIESIPSYWVPITNLLHRRIGNPQTDEAFLWSRSPLSKVDQIKIPMLIAHGANDTRVKLSETEQIVAAMKAKGIDYKLMVFDDEGHGFTKPKNRLAFYSATERFLAEHLGGRAE